LDADHLSLTYAEALAALGRARARLIAPIDKPRSDLLISLLTQTKLVTVTGTMMSIGRLPGDFPVKEFDHPIHYQKLHEKSLQWLEQCGIPARRSFAPLATSGYATLFARKEKSIVANDKLENFFTRLIHCFLIETQIILAKQYYHGLGLYNQEGRFSILSEELPPEFQGDGWDWSGLGQIEFDQLHGRIFLEYCVVMIRAQWDKIIRLSCLAFGLKTNWGSIADGLQSLEQEFKSKEKFHPWCSHHMKILIQIANEQLSEDGWLKKFRDPLMHDVGQHSIGVVPHKKSSLTTSEMWDRVREEHNWLREGMMAMLVALASKNS
jgi:hypothetical protein